MGQKQSTKKVIESLDKKEKKHVHVYSDPVLSNNPQERPIFMNSLPSSLSHLDQDGEESHADPIYYPVQSTIFNKTMSRGRRIKTPTVLFYFDYRSKLLWMLDDNLMKWRFNDLLYSRFESSTDTEFSRFEQAVFRAEFPEYIRYSTLIATNDKTIHVLGKYHLEYKTWSNSFKLKHTNIHNIKWPTVCFGGNNIFSLSGEEEGGSYSTKCKRYIIDLEVWVPFQDIPAPHMFGSATCYTSTDEKNGSFKLMVVGGYKSANPKTINENISMYDFKSDVWTTLSLSIFTRKVPQLVRSPLVQSVEGRLFLFGTEDQWELYELDIPSERLRSYGEVPNKSQISLKEPTAFYVDDGEEIVLLLDEMCRNEGPEHKSDSPIVKSIKDLSIWKFNMIEDANSES